MRWLQVQPGDIDDYTTASNICLRISNKVYCSTMLRILINSLGPRKTRCKFKSSAAPLAIKSELTYEDIGTLKFRLFGTDRLAESRASPFLLRLRPTHTYSRATSLQSILHRSLLK